MKNLGVAIDLPLSSSPSSHTSLDWGSGRSIEQEKILSNCIRLEELFAELESQTQEDIGPTELETAIELLEENQRLFQTVQSSFQ